MTMQTKRRTAMLLLAVLAMSVAGCAKQKVSRMPQANAAYHSGNYGLAYREALSMTSVRDPGVRAEASYLAGMAALKQNQLRRAEEYLGHATRSPDRALRADALVNLGLVQAQLGKHQQAANSLLAAAPDLQGQDRANAYYHAAMAQQKLGQWSSARTNLMLAQKATADRGFRGQVAEQFDVTGYTIQVAAFANDANAQKAAVALAAKAEGAGLGTPRLAPRTDPQGRTLTAVQVGQFTTYQSAAAARDRLAEPQAVIVPLAGR